MTFNASSDHNCFITPCGLHSPLYDLSSCHCDEGTHNPIPFPMVFNFTSLQNAEERYSWAADERIYRLAILTRYHDQKVISKIITMVSMVDFQVEAIFQD